MCAEKKCQSWLQDAAMKTAGQNLEFFLALRQTPGHASSHVPCRRPQPWPLHMRLHSGEQNNSRWPTEIYTGRRMLFSWFRHRKDDLKRGNGKGRRPFRESSDKRLHQRQFGMAAEAADSRRLMSRHPFADIAPALAQTWAIELVVDILHIAGAEHAEAHSILWQGGSSSQSTAQRQTPARDQVSFPCLGESFPDPRRILLDASG